MKSLGFAKNENNLLYFAIVIFFFTPNIPSYGERLVTSESIVQGLAKPSTIDTNPQDHSRPKGTLRKKPKEPFDFKGKIHIMIQATAWSIPKVSLEINFEVNSTTIIPEDLKLLKIISEALKNPLIGQNKILIGGHTDESGSKEYNKKLSAKRAQRIKNILVSEYNINSDELIAIGFGEDKPLKGLPANHPRTEELNYITCQIIIRKGHKCLKAFFFQILSIIFLFKVVYADPSQLMNEAISLSGKIEGQSQKSRLATYKVILEKLNTIVNEFPGSDETRKIISKQSIGNFTPEK